MGFDLNGLSSPILLRGDEKTAFRDPAPLLWQGTLHLFYTLSRLEEDGKSCLYVAESRSRDLVRWSPPRLLTPRDRGKNYSSPGDVIRYGERWVMCLQTYCRENGEKYGNDRSRLYTMESGDLETWTAPSLLRVKGPAVPEAEMGRMIDPYLLRDRTDPEVWWCFYKQDGVSVSWSRDLKNWSFAGHAPAGENACVVPWRGGYLLFDSPENGIGMHFSRDLLHWEEVREPLTLGQRGWEWARGRLTAGAVLDAREVPGLGCYLMFFHGSGPEDESVLFDTNASIGIAWSDDLLHWSWPGKKERERC